MFQVHFVLSVSQPWNQPFLKGALIQFSGGYLENKILVLGIGASQLRGALSEQS